MFKRKNKEQIPEIIKIHKIIEELKKAEEPYEQIVDIYDEKIWEYRRQINEIWED